MQATRVETVGFFRASCGTCFGGSIQFRRPFLTPIFTSLYPPPGCTVLVMQFPDQRTFAAAWRQAVVVWLRRQSLISVTDQQPTDTNKQLLLPLFSEKRSH